MRVLNPFGFALAAALAVASPAVASDAPIIPLDVTGPRPTAQLVIGAHAPATVIFDTGAAGSVLLPDYAAKVALPNEGEARVGSPAGGAPRIGYRTTIASARLGEAQFANARAVVVDLGLPLEGISGVISPYVFSGSLVRFELKRSRVVIAPKTPETIPTGESLSYGGRHPLPSATIDVAGIKVEAHIDTGNGRGLALPLELAQQVKLKTPLTPTKELRMVSSAHKAFTAEISGTVTIGPLTLSDPAVVFVEGVPTANVGFSVLKELTIVLDPAERRGWLLPGT